MNRDALFPRAPTPLMNKTAPRPPAHPSGSRLAAPDDADYLGMMQADVLPGGDLVAQGIRDLAGGVESDAALLVSIGAQRLVRSGFLVPNPLPDAERRLYARLAAADSNAAHSRYNALIRRLVSFERASECASR
jgi:hypothetical protein